LELISDGAHVFVKVTGPGTYEGNDLSKGFKGMELNTTVPGELGGNAEAGDFKILS